MNNQKKTAHIIGISGKAMSALAIMLLQNGWHVTGSDEGSFDPIASFLKAHEIGFFKSHQASNIPKDVNVVVIGKSSKLKIKNNPEVKAAFDLQEQGKVEVVSLPQMLRRLVGHQKQLLVAGSYGKSTCTALLAWCLDYLKHDPSYMMGALPYNFSVHGFIGQGEWVVIEGDEYPSSNWDSRSKFLHFSPSSLLLTSAEHDHVTVFPALEDYLNTYRKLLASIDKNSPVIVCEDNPNIKRLMHEFSEHNFITYGKDGLYKLTNIKHSMISSATVVNKNNDVLLNFETSLLGDHNLQNILGVITVLFENGLVNSVEMLAEAIKKFKGIRRRLDNIGSVNGNPVYEGYGSNYTKAITAIAAVAGHYKDKKVHVVFEPHTFTWQDKSSRDQYKTVFAGVDSVVIMPPPALHKKQADNQLTVGDIAALVTEAGIENTKVFTDPREVLNSLNNLPHGDYIILLLTSGDLHGLPSMIKNKHTA